MFLNPSLALALAFFSPSVNHTIADEQDISIEELLGPEAPPELVHKKPVVGEHYVPVLDLTTEVSDASVDPLIKEIALDNQDGAEAIIIRFNTPGGNVASGQKLDLAFQDCKAKIVCVVQGMSASMGYFLLQSCDERIMSKDSVLMAHAPASGVQGQPAHVRQFLKMLDALNDALIEHMCAKTHLSFRQFKAKIAYDQEYWMTWREAMRIGAVDYVVNNAKEVIESYKKTGHGPKH
jgi:ATP-dependent Clp endopeptidase proteolytic subunit ClpP